MDADHHGSANLEGFNLLLPLPYRVAVILVAGVWGWGLNLHYLSLVKIDVPALIRYPSRSSSGSVPVYKSTYHLATLLSIPLVLSLALFWTITRRSPELVLAWEILPQSYLFIFAALLFLPLHHLSRTGRHRLLVTLKRVSLGGLAEAQDGKFGDIIFADVLTSYAKVFGDMFVSFCMFFASGVSSTGIPDRACGGHLAVPLLVSVPSIIRLRQCLIEYYRVQKRGVASVDGWGGQHLANALKYASAFPVIILTALQHSYDPSNVGMSEAGLHKLWILFALIHSFFTFYWDVAKDWDLPLFSDLLTQFRRNPYHLVTSQPDLSLDECDPRPFGLRRHRFFHANKLYYAAIAIDCVLRFTWLSRLTVRLNWMNDLESGVFVVMVLEVARRWMWIFLRVETEWVRSTQGPAPDDILLGEFTPKIDED
ncbi:protein-ER retention protein [Ophidiomyces ophidiicola]|nr:protein-ER retention protein [Ophidiomyces ophidiicola]KAI1977752.1 protein-ER retention protein [Ophidiomyces ophidiicola]KAI1985340.1 protein-ER retention protein [Ophidiomyces ophidiicola]KAI2002985.1 protein-ER retention protein [Ophidiomyces ophidiicola]KAI2083312.1 protein-ER retention protein [Ophidiomyces ophidiicola]